MREEPVVSQGYACSRCNVIKEENPEKEPIPTKIVQVRWNSGKCKQCSKDKKTTRDPLNTIKRYVLEHVYPYIVFWTKDESFLVLPLKWKTTLEYMKGFDFGHFFS